MQWQILQVAKADWGPWNEASHHSTYYHPAACIYTGRDDNMLNGKYTVHTIFPSIWYFFQILIILFSLSILSKFASNSYAFPIVIAQNYQDFCIIPTELPWECFLCLLAACAGLQRHMIAHGVYIFWYFVACGSVTFWWHMKLLHVLHVHSLRLAPQCRAFV